MKTTCTQDYIDRLTAAGMRIDDATVLVNDFLRELDFDGLAGYCLEFEAIHRHVAAVQS